VILAAGSSSRMGAPKQILRFEGQSLLRRAALAVWMLNDCYFGLCLGLNGTHSYPWMATA